MSVPVPGWGARPRLFQPRLAIFWVLVVLLVLGTAGIGLTFVPAFQVAPGASLVAIFVWALYAVPWVVYLRRIDMLEAEPGRVLVLAALWGGVVATTFALLPNESVFSLASKLGGPEFGSAWGAALAGPADEELLKGLGLWVIFLLVRNQINTPLDGLIYGAFIGLGFQVVEDALYTTNLIVDTAGEEAGSAIVIMFIVRGLLAGLFAHAVFTGIMGFGFGYLVTRLDQGKRRRVLVFGAAVFAAYGFHFLWNSPLLQDAIKFPLLVFFVKGIPCFVLFVVLYRMSLRQETPAFRALLEPEIPTGAVTEDELTTLTSHRLRRKELRAARKSGGRARRRALRRLRRDQAALAMAIAGASSLDDPAVARMRERVLAARQKLSPSGGSPTALQGAGQD